jgi:hypothetical protein
VSLGRMVDWDRVDQLRKNGWDWDEIASDPKVGFQAVKGAGDPGRNLQVLYRKRKGRATAASEAAPKPSKRIADEAERKWGLVRGGYLATPLLGMWALMAFLVPSPVGLILPAIPYVAFFVAIAAIILIYGLYRSSKRWSAVYRNTLIGGIVLGLVFAGVVALAGVLAFGCPVLPSAATLPSEPGPGWVKAGVTPWTQNGLPVVYFYGASWCPYCSASSWAIWKTLYEFGSLSGNYTSFSSSTDVYAGTPEMVLGNAVLNSPNITFVVSEDLSGVDGSFPGTSNCYEAAYVGAYSGGSIPFVVINGQYIHGGSTLIDPTTLASYTNSMTSGAGATQVEQQVHSESGSAWNAVSTQAYWMMAMCAKAAGGNVAYLAAHYGWSSGTRAAVANDMNALT